MKLYHVWLLDTEPQAIEIEAESPEDARTKTECMLDEGTLWEHVRAEFTEGSYEILSVEDAH